MSNGNPTTKSNAPIPNTMIQLIITMDSATGAVNVQGPINNLLLVYGLLEAAKVSCQDFVKQQNSGNKIVPVTAMPNLRM